MLADCTRAVSARSMNDQLRHAEREAGRPRKTGCRSKVGLQRPGHWNEGREKTTPVSFLTGVDKSPAWGPGQLHGAEYPNSFRREDVRVA